MPWPPRELPLGLVDDLLERVKRQDERERLAAEVEVVRQILIERDDDLLALLAEAKAPPGIVRKVKKHLADDRQSRALTARETASRLSLTTALGRCSTICAARGWPSCVAKPRPCSRDARSSIAKPKTSTARCRSRRRTRGSASSSSGPARPHERLTTLNDEAKQLDRS